MAKRKATFDERAINLVRNRALKTPGGIEVPMFVEVADGSFMDINDVKANRKARAAFVAKLRSELQDLNDLRTQKTRLIFWLQH